MFPWNQRSRRAHRKKNSSFLVAREKPQADSGSEITSVDEETYTMKSTPATSILQTDEGSDKALVNQNDCLLDRSIPDSMHTVSDQYIDSRSDQGPLDERSDRDRSIDYDLIAHIAENNVALLDQEDFFPDLEPATAIQHSNNDDDTGSTEHIECDVCSKDSPDLCCLTCDPKWIPYHTSCWNSERQHRSGRNQRYQTHLSIPITSLGRLRYLNEPNKQTSIAESRLQADDLNSFIEFDMRSKRLRFGHRAFPLLRHRRDHHGAQYPSFVSFVGRTMNGKSFLIRALQYREAAERLPTPIPAPGAKAHNLASTSSDIHLYADSATACAEAPILYLDCEGIEGSDVPISLASRRVPDDAIAPRRDIVDTAYPRLVYAFSTCIVFVTSGPLAGADDIKRRLITYASQGASGSKNQGFKPSLFVVFNHFKDGNQPDFDWSIDSSTNAFLASGRRTELENFYSNIRVVYIPSMDRAEAVIALKQVDEFERVLRGEHEKAFLRRREFRLDFTPEQLAPFLQRALSHFSKDRNAVFDWAAEAPPSTFSSDASDAMLIDLWMQYMRHHAASKFLPQMRYDLVRGEFERHVMLCLRLELRRHPPPGLHCSVVPPNWVKQVQQLRLEYIPCGASSPSGLKCEKVRLRHGDYHQGLTNKTFPVTRWLGAYEPSGYVTTSETFQESFKATLERYSTKKASLDDLKTLLIPNIRSIASCLGCLQGPPSTVFACGHAFCLDCIRELTDNDPLPHRRKDIRCPIHQEPQNFSPRLLPIQSGYRILSLDGGGVKGLAQLIMLRDIEKRCFEIPLTHLFDLVVGTSIGGQIALALNTQTESGPLTVAAAMVKFRELMKSAFDRKSLVVPVLSWFMDRTKYKTTTLESYLQDLFGKETKLFSAAKSSQLCLPNIAVTTVTLQPFKAHLVTNYNRISSADAFPLLFGPTPNDCMPVWAAARSTSAAVPYFKPLEWQGQMLLDGGFKLNCPAACAYSEARCIWPDKYCDILLSLGAGKATNREAPPVHHKLFRLAYAIADDMTDAEGAWAEFLATLVQKDGIFRLNPTYSGHGFQLDEFQKLNEIESQAEEWIATQNTPLCNICDQLIAALFFFRPCGFIEDGVQAAEVLCRLPADLKARQNLVYGMLQEADSNLFLIEYDGCSGRTCAYINVAGALGNLRVAAELCLRVKLRDLPATGGIKIHVKMRSLGTRRWLPISGSPYVI